MHETAAGPGAPAIVRPVYSGRLHSKQRSNIFGSKSNLMGLMFPCNMAFDTDCRRH